MAEFKPTFRRLECKFRIVPLKVCDMPLVSYRSSSPHHPYAVPTYLRLRKNSNHRAIVNCPRATLEHRHLTGDGLLSEKSLLSWERNRLLLERQQNWGGY